VDAGGALLALSPEEPPPPQAVKADAVSHTDAITKAWRLYCTTSPEPAHAGMPA
jgi:hypothetical protein